MIKLSEYVTQFLVDNGVSCAFGVSGGASIHLLHSISENSSIKLICPHHEQSGAMAADGYARSSGKLGVAVATSGPGATNMITGICCSYYDSVPVLYLTGQVSTFRAVGNTGVRQVGFQETPITEMVSPITKYCVKIKNPAEIKYELQKAIHIAKSGRPGPVLIDIPDNFQRTMVEPEGLVEYSPSSIEKITEGFSNEKLKLIQMAIKKSKRPVIIAGWGLNLAGVQESFRQFSTGLNIPVACTWGASNILSDNKTLNLGTFGTHGTRSANFAVQNADLIISLGSRLDTKATGTPVNTFAREAIKVMVDIDENELGKFRHFDLTMDLLVHADLAEFFSRFETNNISDLRDDYENWFAQVKAWKELEKSVDSQIAQTQEINPYNFFEKFSGSLSSASKIFIDTGCSIAWAMQAANFKEMHSVFHDFNNTAMGWALPASIGSHAEYPLIDHYCIVGDGAFMMTMQELATVRHHNLPLKIFLINNGGYSMIKQTQEQWLESKHIASGLKDISFPSFEKVAKSFGFRYLELSETKEIDNTLNKVVTMTDPVFVNLIISPDARVIPQVKFGRANEDMEPLLSREQFHKAMIIPSLPSSD